MCPGPAWCIGLTGPARCSLDSLDSLSRPRREAGGGLGQAGPQAVSLWSRTRGRRAAATESVGALRGIGGRGGRETGKREGGEDGGHQLAVANTAI